MRHVVACLALLAVAASPRGGCGNGTSSRYEPCAGKACGDRCTLCAPGDPGCVETMDLKACDRSGACVPEGRCACAEVDPCAGKACGATCNPCGDERPCPTLVATGCDPTGACVTMGAFTCPAVDPCAGKACGERCPIDPPCRLADPPCLAPSILGYCTTSGGCVAAAPACAPYDPCAGKACGEPCSPCAPGTSCMAILCVTACDGAGRCTCSGGGAGCP